MLVNLQTCNSGQDEIPDISDLPRNKCNVTKEIKVTKNGKCGDYVEFVEAKWRLDPKVHILYQLKTIKIILQ